MGSRARPGQEPPPPTELYNKQITFTLIKYSEDGTEIRKTVRSRVGGVLAESRDEADYSIYMPLKEVEAMNVWFTGQRLDRNKMGYNNVIVRAADLDQVLSVADQIADMGFQAWTPQSFSAGHQQLLCGAASGIWRRGRDCPAGGGHRHCQYHGHGYFGAHS
ncbi:MAG: hypothetical protein M5U34_23120 [Chloroflexi bacterium]|nr:hypothetical protein [Chloroflexota bacterium]